MRDMTKFRKKPVVVDAFQWWPSRYAEDFPEWFSSAIANGIVFYQGGDNPYCTIETLEGAMKVSSGDYVIRGVKGEMYPCKPDIFEATYEPVK